MKTSLILTTSWLASNPRRVRTMMITLMLILTLIAVLGTGSIALAGGATGGSHCPTTC